MTTGSSFTIILRCRRVERRARLPTQPHPNRHLQSQTDSSKPPDGQAQTEFSEILLETFVNPQPAGKQQKHARQNAGDEQRPRQCSDLGDQFPLLPGDVFLRRVEEDLIILVAGQNTAPDQQDYKNSRNNSPDNQKIKDRGCKGAFHGDLRMNRPAMPAGIEAGKGYCVFLAGSIAPQIEISRVNYQENECRPDYPRFAFVDALSSFFKSFAGSLLDWAHIAHIGLALTKDRPAGRIKNASQVVGSHQGQLS